MRELPDILEILPLAGPPRGTIGVPGSKSITNRALILAALSEGNCVLRGALWAEDTQVMVDSLQRLGFKVEVAPDPNEECNRTLTVEGRGGEIPASQAELHVGNAGTAARFLAALVALGHGKYSLRGDERMHRRPMKELFDALRELGAQIEARGDQLPAAICARGISARTVTIRAEKSSQFASALLLISRAAKLQVQVSGSDENGYVAMTRRMLDEFASQYAIEPDLSSASYFKAVEFICGGSVEVAGWPKDSLQMDGRFPKFLPPPPRVSRLRDLGDSVLTLAVCGLFGRQPLSITEAARLRDQECDRIAAMVTELKKVGARVEEREEGFCVWPAPEGTLRGAEIETYNDHRLAMCFSVLGLKVRGVKIKNPACVAKTFPNFFDKLEQLRR